MAVQPPKNLPQTEQPDSLLAALNQDLAEQNQLREEQARIKKQMEEREAQAGQGWIETHNYIYNEQKAANEGRLTPLQEQVIATQDSQVREREAAHARQKPSTGSGEQQR